MERTKEVEQKEDNSISEPPPLAVVRRPGFKKKINCLGFGFYKMKTLKQCLREEATEAKKLTLLERMFTRARKATTRDCCKPGGAVVSHGSSKREAKRKILQLFGK